MDTICIPLCEPTVLLKGALIDRLEIISRYVTMWEASVVCEEHRNFIRKRNRKNLGVTKNERKAYRKREGYDGYLSDLETKPYYRKAILSKPSFKSAREALMSS